jgi:ABC-2 type transport system permease protein
MRIVWYREVLRFLRTRTRLIGGIVQPLGFLVVMGTGLSPIVGSLPEGVSYRTFIFPGILAMSVTMSSLYSTVSIVYDREFGFMREMLAAPVSRAAIAMGKATGGATIAFAQAILLIAFAPLVGVSLTAASVVELLVALLMLALMITALGIALSSRMSRMESVQVVMSLAIQPLVFTSGAIFPISNLPRWLAVVCYINPATYGVDAARRAVLGNEFALVIRGWTIPLWFDVFVMVAFGCGMFVLATRQLTRLP